MDIFLQLIQLNSFKDPNMKNIPIFETGITLLTKYVWFGDFNAKKVVLHTINGIHCFLIILMILAMKESVI